MKRHVQMMGDQILRVVFGLGRWEAFSHGAETVCYFRWRQVSFAQEQMHAGLLRPDNVATEVFGEIESVIKTSNRINPLYLALIIFIDMSRLRNKNRFLFTIK